MTCCKDGCNLNKYTTDGYCYSHAYLTDTDDNIIMNHIRNKFYEFDKAKGITKFRKMLRLGGYISYKKNFFLKLEKDNKLFKTVYNRYIEKDLIQEAINCDYDVSESDKIYFNNIRDRFNIIKNELDTT